MAEGDFSQVGPLVTWVDIARALGGLDPASEGWRSRPKGLSRIYVDWTGVEIENDPNVSSSDDIINWLVRSLPVKIARDPLRILLDGPPGLESVGVSFFSSSGNGNAKRVNLGVVDGEMTFVADEDIPSNVRSVPVVACHSVKGGTGRTTCAIAVALRWAERVKQSVLVVDADLEAPGLSYLFSAMRTDALVSFEDIVALAHADPKPSFEGTVTWAASRIMGQRIGPLIVLPIRRALNELASSTIRAEHLATASHPYALADLLSELGRAAGCAGVVVDVRAGLAPIAAQLALDPSVPRIICTSLADQSLNATAAFISFVARELRKIGQSIPPPLIVVNRIPSIFRDYGTDDIALEPFLSQVEKSLFEDDAQVETASDQPVLDNEQELSPYLLAKVGDIADLHVPKRRWDEFVIQLQTSGFLSRLDPVLQDWFERVLPINATAPVQVPSPVNDPEKSAQERRHMLASFAGSIEYAESSKTLIETPLVTAPLRALAAQTSQPPIVIIEGAKGTGKTLTARYLLGRKTWSAAVLDLIGAKSSFDAPMLPVLGSVQSSEPYLAEILGRRLSVRSELGFTAEPQTVAITKSLIEQKLRRGGDETGWTDFWLDTIAWSAGFEPGRHGAGAGLIDYLRATGRRVIAVIEGVEELYETTRDPGLPTMLRSLLIDLPLRLRTEIGRPLGLIVFARRDTVDIGVTQNRQQFRSQYADYALTWTETDVLELAAWMSTKCGALTIWDENFRNLQPLEKERRLDALWGRKLGRDEVPGGKRVQEAFTAGWVIAVLSDLQDRLAARDFVRFLKEAASASVSVQDTTGFGSRLLLPAALRSAVAPTSKVKVQDTIEEIRELTPIFAKFTTNEGTVRAPIDEDDIARLKISDADLNLLRIHGIILGESSPYEVAELFRIGLGLRHAGARYSVVGMRRRAKQRATVSSGG